MIPAREGPVEQVSPVLLLGGLLQERAGGAGVADGRLLCRAEDLGEVERVGVVDEGFFELAVDADPFEGCRLAAKRGGDGDATD
ncbi:hypothetical protein OH807_07620 [Kitasatospora sp. NBC_01560]|uniref:hypothetical protein n=1 Tax=Kitasatospora sp. NBC_01560 TaxID=2975965 RepID=UPI0038663CFD